MLILFLFGLFRVSAQGIVYDDTGAATFPAGTLQSLTFTDVEFNYTNLLNATSNLESGVIADVYASGIVILEVYGGNDKSKLIFKKTLSTTSSVFSGAPEPITWKTILVSSDNTKILASDINYKTGDPSKCSFITDPSLFKASIVSANGDYSFYSPYNECLKDNNFKQNQIVSVRISAKNAKVKRIKYPGQTQELVLGDMNTSKPFGVTIFINGISQGKVISGTIPTYNAKVGDDIKFVFENTYPALERIPVFEGIPATWEVNFSGETKYYCIPSIQPNARKPWIGFDSQVHGSLLRRYPTGYKENFPDFEKNASGQIISWSWILQREMDATKDTYTPVYKWPKEKTTPVKQRNSQKEGLNLELLNAYNDPYFKSYQGSIFYLEGTDPDEIYYMDGQDVNTFDHPPLHGLVRKTGEAWKQVSYGESEDPINDVISAYYKNRDKSINLSSVKSNCYEIQDLGTSPAFPDGNGTGNAKAPGLCKIRIGSREVVFKLNVTSGLSNNSGFYANIIGTRWPGYNETVSYSIKGFQGLSINDLKRYFLVYTNENSIGGVSKSIFYLKKKSDSELSTISSTGTTTVDVALKGNGYNSLTLYKYDRTGLDSVVVGGKELLSIVLRFCTVPNGNPGLQLGEVADGNYIYLEDFRDNKAGDPLYVSKFSRYMKKFVREYVIQKDSTITFYTLDSDPFTFYNTSTEWYLSSRRQAKRMPLMGNDSQYENVKYYLDPLNADGSVQTLTTTPVGQGSTFTKKFTQVGDYQLRVVFRTQDNALFHRLKIRNYASPTKGEVYVRMLTSREQALLNFYDNKYCIAEVGGILSKYMYVDGFRSQQPINRFGRYNDYYSVYNWTDGFGNLLKNPDVIINTLASYSEHSWRPHYWVRHFSDKPYPSDINSALFTDINSIPDIIRPLFTDVPEPHQVRLPWAPSTATEGLRFRTNIKVIYDMKQYFDNSTGAFSGNAKVISSSEVYNKFIKDDDADKKELFNDLMFGRKIIIPVGPTTLKVNNVSNVSGKPNVYITSWSNQGVTKAAISEENSILEKGLNKVFLYPSPANDKLNVQLPELDMAFVETSIYGFSGRLIFKGQFLIKGNNTISLNTTSYPDGVYVIHMQSPDKSWNSIVKFIVKH